MRTRVSIPEVAVEYACPYCGAAPDWPCVVRGTSRPTASMHSDRFMQLCREQFLEGVFQSEWCAKLKGHQGQHASHGATLRWAHGAGYSISELEELVK